MSRRTGKPALLVSCYFPRSVVLEGVGTFVTGLAAGMAEGGWDVRIVLPAGEHPFIPGVRTTGYRSGPGGLVRYLRAVREASRQADAVLLVENNPNMAFVARWSRRPASTFCYFYTPLEPLRAAWEMGLTGQGLAHAAAKSALWSGWLRGGALRCIVSTRYQAGQLRRLSPEEVHVLPASSVSRGQEFPPREQARRELGWDAREPVIGYLGHFSPAKGVEHLLEALAALPSGTLALAHSGKGRLGRRGRRLLERLRRAGRLRLFGRVHVPTFLAACDCIVLPYITSSIHHLPLVLVESFAAATAVATTAVGGLSEVHLPGETGSTVRHPRDLHRGIAEVLADGCENAHRMGRRARAVFEERLSREVLCGRLSAILKEALP